MPFQRKNTWMYPWEQDAQAGKEFIYPISSDSMYHLWTRALNAVSISGVLVIRFHNKPLGIAGSPRLIQDILMDWSSIPDVPKHPRVSEELELLAASVSPTSPSNEFAFLTFRVSDKPSSLPALLFGMAESGKIAGILRYRRIHALLIPLSVLARFRHEAKQRTKWVNETLAWIGDSFFSY